MSLVKRLFCQARFDPRSSGLRFIELSNCRRSGKVNNFVTRLEFNHSARALPVALIN